MEQIKFYGKYLPEQKSNRAYEPLVGKISQLNGTGGIGLEYWLPTNEVDFVHIFAEVLYGAPLQSHASVEVFSNTSIKQFTSFSVGVGFGRHR